MKMSKLFALSVLALSASIVSAQTIKVATGSQKGTYATMFKELNAQCATSLPMIETVTTGSVQNIDLLTGNQVNAAFTQTDVLYFRSRTEELGNVKTLVALHPEEVHVITRVSSGIKSGGFVGVGGKEIQFNSISDLANYKVGAAGGSYVTAQVIRLQSEIPFQAINYEDSAKALVALGKGEVEAVIMVGGAPLGAVAELPSSFKLIAIPESVQAKLKGVYKPARLSYTKLNAQGVPTVATDAIFITREYKTDRMKQSLSKFRECFNKTVPELQETTGTHPAWQKVDTSNKGKWVWYDVK